ncbi:MAG: acetolactate synthase small subunit [Chloroflexi bacterium]|nr:acetolactate synthase small subunit [Chloroflexota bacterium]MCH7953605.1 acetolactate synthase small subunit [Chloroflexota bacterium]MCI0783685.1 acetolactate synthase small subunit [Chloroflexota bacterium]MCI0813745.1 acetolactate synthase small subunit [Chloroflexota bacterium]MCI0840092.1 acetolactate synthase small subunit [Chloroflexota bacterium]
MTNSTDEIRKIKPHTIIALVEDRPGVLNRIVSKWRQRGFNIESLAVGHSEKPGLSRMTFVVDSDANAEQVVRQLDKLVDVVDIRDVSHEDTVSREMAIIKLKSTKETRSQLIDIAEVFKANVLDVSPDSLILEATGEEEKIDSLVTLLQDYEIIELVRTGRVTMIRGSEVSHPELPEEEQYDRYPGVHTW